MVHSVEIAQILSHIFGKNFVKVTFSLKNLLKSWFDEFFFSEREFHVFPHVCRKVVITQCEKRRNSLSHFFRKNVKVMIFLKKLLKNWFHEIFFQWGERISRFSTRTLCTAQCENYGNSLSRIFDKNFGKSMVLLKKLLNGSWFDDFFSSLCCAQHTVEITEFYCHNFSANF